jgi:hypothetical protein
MAQSTYYIQLPYLNGNGDPITVRLANEFDAQQLVDAKTHRKLQAEKGSYVLTPIVTAATNVEFQIGSTRY